MVLLAFTAALIAFTLLTTFAIGTSVHRKIQLQQSADTAAYSLAVQEARAFNFYAFTNRAILSHYVAMMAIYGHMSYLAAYEGYLNEIASNWCSGGGSVGTDVIDNQDELMFLGIGFAIACAASLGTCSYCCDCASTEFQESSNVGNLCNGITQKLQQVDQDLGLTTKSSSVMRRLHDSAKLHYGYITTIKLAQDAYDVKLQADLASNGVLKAVAGSTDAAGTYQAPSTALGLLNEGMAKPPGTNLVGYCDSVTSLTCPHTSQMGKELLNTQRAASNASRYGPMSYGGDWLTNRSFSLATAPGDLFEVQILRLFSNPVYYINAFSGTGMSREIHEGSTQRSEGPVYNVVHDPKGEGGLSIAGEDHGKVWLSMDLEPVFNGACPPAVASAREFHTWAYSEPYSLPQSEGGGTGQSELAFADGTIVTHDQGIDLDLGGGPGASGMHGVHGVLMPTINFVADSTEPLFNQPRTWAVVSDSMAPSADAQKAWAKNVSLTFGGESYGYDNGPADVAPWKSMLAVSQGLAYYHRPGDWKEPPNFYNPFWRAKLQPFAGAYENWKDYAAVVAAGAGANAAKDAALVGAALPLTQ